MKKIAETRPHPYVYVGISGGSTCLKSIVKQVAKYMEIDLEFMLSKSRRREAVYGRHISSYIIKEYSPLTTLREIAEVTGDRGHASVINSIEEVENLLETDVTFLMMFNKIKDSIILYENEGAVTVGDEYLRIQKEKRNKEANQLFTNL